mgnify:CR=1 FL=1
MYSKRPSYKYREMAESHRKSILWNIFITTECGSESYIQKLKDNILTHSVKIDELKLEMEMTSRNICRLETAIRDNDQNELSRDLNPALNEYKNRLMECEKKYTIEQNNKQYYENLPTFLEEYIKRRNNIMTIKQNIKDIATKINLEAQERIAKETKDLRNKLSQAELEIKNSRLNKSNIECANYICEFCGSSK